MRRKLYVAIATLVCVGCAENEPESLSFPAASGIDHGVLRGHTYVNHFFNFRLTIPDEWHVLNARHVDQLVQDIRRSAPADDPLGQAFAATERESGHLLMALAAPPGAPVFGARIIVRAQRIDCDPAVCTAADYLEQTRIEFRGSTMFQVKWGEIEHECKVGSLVMDMLPGSLSDGPGTLNAGFGNVYQRVYAARIKDCILLITIAYTDDAEHSALLKILETITRADA